MAGQLSRERIMEMEEEMNRFEQEIAQPQGHPESHSFGGSSAIQFIPHQLQHHVIGQSEPPTGFLRQPPFPPQHLMGPMQMGPNPSFGHPHVVGPMSGGAPTFVGPSMSRQHFPAPPQPPTLVMPRPPAPSEAVVVATPTVYAAPPVKLVTVYQEHKSEVTRPLPPPPPIPAVLKPEVPVEAPPPVSIHKGVVGRPPDHTYEEPSTTATTKRSSKKKKIVRLAGSQIWEDNSLLDWDLDDFRIFCGDLGNDVTDEILTRAFGRYTSFIKAKVVRDKRTNKTKGYGFVSFKDPQDFIKAMREMNGKYVGSRPIKLRKSSWRDRNIEVVRKKQKEKEKLGLL